MATLGSRLTRADFWKQLNQTPAQTTDWDVLIIGGGITGAGVLREAARRGLKALLVEQRDFAWGTSSRSSKMVHGGLRYIAAGDIKLTRDAVHERQRLLKEAPGLVDPMGYIFAHRHGQFPGKRVFNTLMNVYDFFAGRRDYRSLGVDELLLHMPYLSDKALQGATRYTDAATDDTRLVLRVLQEARQDGGHALNYVRAQHLLREDGRVVGAQLRDSLSNTDLTLRARVVVNATGAWVDQLRHEVTPETCIRPLRGSHLVFPAWRLPVFECLTFMHAQDKRPVFIFPWEGVTVLGTTDLDHDQDPNEEARISQKEIDYLISGLREQFPSLDLRVHDAIASYAGVRPVISQGSGDPSKERRDHKVWRDAGLISVSGGKLTTFRLIALDVLKAAAADLPMAAMEDTGAPMFTTPAPLTGAGRHLGFSQQQRLLGHYGEAAQALIHAAQVEELTLIPGTHTLWAELPWAAATEAVMHLEDLLLRRTRLGLLLPAGGQAYLPRIRQLCQKKLGWDDAHWQTEESAYRQTWQRYYHVPTQVA